MTNSTRRRFLLLCPLVLAGSLFAGPLASVSVRAQAPAAPGAPAGEEEESEGRPLDGYLAMLMLASGALFVVGKTARR